MNLDKKKKCKICISDQKNSTEEKQVSFFLTSYFCKSPSLKVTIIASFKYIPPEIFFVYVRICMQACKKRIQKPTERVGKIIWRVREKNALHVLGPEFDTQHYVLLSAPQRIDSSDLLYSWPEQCYITGSNSESIGHKTRLNIIRNGSWFSWAPFGRSTNT